MGSDPELVKPEESHIESLRREQTNFELDPTIDKRVTRKCGKYYSLPYAFT